MFSVAACLLAACSSDGSDDLPKSDLPPARGATSIELAAPVIPEGGHLIVRLRTGPGLHYGQTYEIDQYVNGRWKYILIGGQPPNPNSVSRPFSPKQDFTTDQTWTPSDVFRVSVAEGPGDYRIRKAFLDPGPGEDFELSAVFRITAA